MCDERDLNMFCAYSFPQLLTFGHVIGFLFSQFSPLLQNNLETTDTSFENPKVERLDSGKKSNVASL